MRPIAFTLGPLTVRWYGVAYAVALIFGLVLLRSEVDRKGLDLDFNDVVDFFLIVFPLGLVGGRIYYVLFNLGYFLDRPLSIIGLNPGSGFGVSGLAIHGGLIGGLIGLSVYVKIKDVPFWDFADALAPALILGQAIGRVGNFLNGDAYGFPTDLPWGVRFKANTAGGMKFPDQALHPAMLYEMIANLIIFFLLWRLRKRGYRSGFIISLYFVLYSAGRSVTSVFRAGSLWFGPIRAPHVVSALLVLGFGGLIYCRRLYRRN
ncbi:prolipoprotein diacylglyceryl transferase [Candidatus Bipolaricaulota bacterium]|nr:prolipoprotein diacylglyceryl transferase [Candidatus Bipolaricaulota bacterium]